MRRLRFAFLSGSNSTRGQNIQRHLARAAEPKSCLSNPKTHLATTWLLGMIGRVHRTSFSAPTLTIVWAAIPTYTSEVPKSDLVNRFCLTVQRKMDGEWLPIVSAKSRSSRSPLLYPQLVGRDHEDVLDGTYKKAKARRRA
jgi:hypothetical protein